MVKNRGLKLLAFLLAVLTFYAIRGATSFEVTYEVPLEVKVDRSEGMAVLDQDPRTVDVTFRGSQDDLRRLDQKQIKAVVQAKAANYEGSERFPIAARDIEGVMGVRVEKVRPSVATVTFDREDRKKVAVIRPRVIGTPLLGRVELEYEPRFVTLKGPKRRLLEKEAVSTEPIDVDGRVESFSKQVRVLAPSDTWVSQIEPSEITVRVNIITESESRQLTNVLVSAMVPPQEGRLVKFEPERVVVTVHGRREVLTSIVADAVKAFVDTTGLDAFASYELPVSVYVPPGVDVSVQVEPETVKVLVTENKPAPPQNSADEAGTP